MVQTHLEVGGLDVFQLWEAFGSPTESRRQCNMCTQFQADCDVGWGVPRRHAYVPDQCASAECPRNWGLLRVTRSCLVSAAAAAAAAAAIAPAAAAAAAIAAATAAATAAAIAAGGFGCTLASEHVETSSTYLNMLVILLSPFRANPGSNE